MGLDRPLHRAPAFYGILLLAVVAGVINGLVAVPILILLILLTRSQDIMGKFTAGPLLQAGSWATVARMTASNVAMLAMLF